MKKRAVLIVLAGLTCAAGGFAQELVANESVQQAEALAGGSGFMDVVAKGGFLGIVLWLALAVLSVAGTHLIVDSFIRIRAQRIIPDGLVRGVREALDAGNLPQALEQCDGEPGALSNILAAGFTNASDGSEAAQEAIGAAADLESEKLLQRINYLNVVGNLAPMLGLLGTVQGMIMAFATLGTEAGAAKNAMLATNISQALYTTAAGLVIAVPALGFFSFFRNRATKIILSMEALTMELMKKVHREK
ncbi:MAG: biopolymer transport protein ExbB [Verrucomicrobiota bacterium]|jgi:biopolymer transport protein ExbB|nr:biopolymer transport protein ExbB [Verrucomicrobiota bacterium]MDK2963985.1 biopolymer transport protein ExbB [Verrucomicrobiota bacterium]